MIADRAWVERNIGFDPIRNPPPDRAFALKAAAGAAAGPDDFQREIIEWDSEGPEGMAFLAFSKATGLSRFVDIPWPKGLEPRTAAKPGLKRDGALPQADVLVVTWTVDEGHALSRVLTPGKDSRNDFMAYTHNFASVVRGMSRGCPAAKAKRLGALWTTSIAGKSVVVFKSESHMSQDTDKRLPAGGAPLPNEVVWRQIIDEVKPKLVITTGTSGGIGKDLEVGDVVVSPIVRFASRAWLRTAPYAGASYHSAAARSRYLSKAKALFKANAAQLPGDNTRAPKIVAVRPSDLAASIVTTDFFGFDTSDDHYRLWGLGDASEMGDALLGKVADAMGAGAPHWIAVRNVSDPQIAAKGLTLKQQANMAADIYKAYGRWSSVCSAIVCWALIAGL